ncbi:TPA: DUF551 domain-containing protein [Citrobacter freundii]|nr:DUF551 domain-containing protein [Citrobacter freundii]HEG1884452.1 DUF551 domain-containing protein [Citrobacter freundii]
MLHRKGQHPWEGITIDCSEYPDRVRYEADRMRHLIGELADEPDILAYDADAHSGYVNPGNSPVTPGAWIPVSERMPGRDYVLAADISGAYYPPHLPNTQVGIYADWFGDGNPSWDDGDGNDLHLKQVTHWQPLPEPPVK